jgi:Uma2 family endonuclease
MIAATATCWAAAPPSSRAEPPEVVALGFLARDQATELIGGKRVVVPRQSAGHYTAIQKTARVLASAFGPGWEVRTQGPITLDSGSEPVPDVAVVPGRADDYGHRHPSRPTLTVEVAESSLAVDRTAKGSLYARAGLAEYWVLNLVDRVLEMYRLPAADPAAPFGWRYARREVLDAAARIAPLAAPDSSIAVAALLP